MKSHSADQHESTRPAKGRRAFTLVELQVLVALVGSLVAVGMPVVVRAREQANRQRCLHNLKTLGLAVHRYADVHEQLPPRGTKRPPRQGWASLLIPHLDEQELLKRYSFKHDWCDPSNAEAIQMHRAVMQCPSTPNQDRLVSGSTVFPDSPRGGQKWTASCSDYIACTSVDRGARRLGVPEDMDLSGAILTDFARRLSDFPDGTAQTLLLVEQAGRPEIWQRGVRTDETPKPERGIWAHHNDNQISIGGHSADGRTSPGPCAINCSNNRGVYSFHPAVANVCFVDGSVRPLREGMSIFVLFALTTRNGGEVINANEF